MNRPKKKEKSKSTQKNFIPPPNFDTGDEPTIASKPKFGIQNKMMHL